MSNCRPFFTASIVCATRGAAISSAFSALRTPSSVLSLSICVSCALPYAFWKIAFCMRSYPRWLTLPAMHTTTLSKPSARASRSRWACPL